MVAGGRTPFTDDDDTLLVKYLAKYNPDVKGRRGNKIYQLLVQNEHNKWSWSSHHPWGGWRDRYVKNQDKFDKRIKKYQKEKGLPMENPIFAHSTQKLKGSDNEEDAEEPQRKRKRSSNENARKRAKVEDEEESSSSAEALPAVDADEENVPGPDGTAPTRSRPTHVPDLYPDLAGLDVPQVGVKLRNPTSSRDTDSRALLPRPAPKVKTSRVAHAPDSDFFASVPPTPTTTTDAASRPPTTASGGSVTSNTSSNEHQSDPSPAKLKSKTRPLPKLVETSFGRTAFSGARWSADKAQSDEDAPWPPVRSRKAKARSENADRGKTRDEMDVPMGTRKPAPLPPRRPPHQRLENTDRRDEMEVERELPVEKPIPPARLPPPQVNAVASSSRVQLSPTSSRWLLSSPVVQQTPWQTPLHAQTSGTSRRQPSTSPHTRRSPSPLDWGSPVTGEALESPANTRIGATSSAKSSPTKTYAGRPREASSPSKPRTTPPPIEIVARSDRRSLPRHDFGSSPPSRARADIARTGASLAIPRLSFTENRFDNTPPNWSTRRSRDRNFIGSVEEGRPERRSRAPSPRTDSTSLHYRLLSPRHAGPSHPRSSTPLATKAKRRAPEPGFMPVPKHPDDDARRHSFPASFLPRVDFNRMRITAPRQSLPPPPPPRREPLPQRHGSLFTPRTPTSAPVSANASPARPRISANDRALVEHLGLQQAINAMAANHRFDTEVVRNVYAASGDLAETDKILLRMRERAEEAGLAALRELTGGRAEEDEYEAPLVLRHRRQRSGATATAASSPRSASSSQRKKRQSDGAFRPQPQTRDVLAETKYTPPTSSRAGGFIRLAKKGRVEEGLMRERRRASGGGTLSAFERDVRMQMRPDMEDDVPRTPPPLPQFTAFASGDEAVLRELERRDVGLSMARTADVARFMLNGSVPSPYR